uniref:C3H1-type domain-containing protein n=1 Tax=Chromera velia CCMP2878 TaxID=1169474 RepID=A0A0G4I4T0_9ALVE|eukprot:Cvel_11004.t1-p1 / transcript=Cvel_11004.t1 / gene=Cvel_11004 / organism=Chromera_velia_CCMP2878 / gene_product=Zinc finger protein 36, C3H1 type-like 2, putative / transcript_product=Zinc finger protein 36, C3H1 type-like 2, putative / location=Cvel_scaffold678:22082-26923(-) / protein_length=1163 / sequence_SO=supercontig / SO=protein_coding / is_pseudo=false
MMDVAVAHASLPRGRVGGGEGGAFGNRMTGGREPRGERRGSAHGGHGGERGGGDSGFLRGQQLRDIDKTKFKTELCRNWSQMGMCQHGDKCIFAHGEEERRERQHMPLYKTQLCRQWHHSDHPGQCSYGERCAFIHDQGEAKARPEGFSRKDSGGIGEGGGATGSVSRGAGERERDGGGGGREGGGGVSKQTRRSSQPSMPSIGGGPSGSVSEGVRQPPWMRRDVSREAGEGGGKPGGGAKRPPQSAPEPRRQDSPSGTEEGVGKQQQQQQQVRGGGGSQTGQHRRSSAALSQPAPPPEKSSGHGVRESNGNGHEVGRGAFGGNGSGVPSSVPPSLNKQQQQQQQQQQHAPARGGQAQSQNPNQNNHRMGGGDAAISKLSCFFSNTPSTSAASPGNGGLEMPGGGADEGVSFSRSISSAAMEKLMTGGGGQPGMPSSLPNSSSVTRATTPLVGSSGSTGGGLFELDAADTGGHFQRSRTGGPSSNNSPQQPSSPVGGVSNGGADIRGDTRDSLASSSAVSVSLPGTRTPGVLSHSGSRSACSVPPPPPSGGGPSPPPPPPPPGHSAFQPPPPGSSSHEAYSRSVLAAAQKEATRAAMNADPGKAQKILGHLSRAQLCQKLRDDLLTQQQSTKNQFPPAGNQPQPPRDEPPNDKRKAHPAPPPPTNPPPALPSFAFSPHSLLRSESMNTEQPTSTLSKPQEAAGGTLQLPPLPPPEGSGSVRNSSSSIPPPPPPPSVNPKGHSSASGLALGGTGGWTPGSRPGMVPVSSHHSSPIALPLSLLLDATPAALGSSDEESKGRKGMETGGDGDREKGGGQNASGDREIQDRIAESQRKAQIRALQQQHHTNQLSAFGMPSSSPANISGLQNEGGSLALGGSFFPSTPAGARTGTALTSFGFSSPGSASGGGPFLHSGGATTKSNQGNSTTNSGQHPSAPPGLPPGALGGSSPAAAWLQQLQLQHGGDPQALLSAAVGETSPLGQLTLTPNALAGLFSPTATASKARVSSGGGGPNSSPTDYAGASAGFLNFSSFLGGVQPLIDTLRLQTGGGGSGGGSGSGEEEGDGWEEGLSRSVSVCATPFGAKGRIAGLADVPPPPVIDTEKEKEKEKEREAGSESGVMQEKEKEKEREREGGSECSGGSSEGGEEEMGSRSAPASICGRKEEG